MMSKVSEALTEMPVLKEVVQKLMHEPNMP